MAKERMTERLRGQKRTVVKRAMEEEKFTF